MDEKNGKAVFISFAECGTICFKNSDSLQRVSKNNSGVKPTFFEPVLVTFPSSLSKLEKSAVFRTVIESTFFFLNLHCNDDSSWLWLLRAPDKFPSPNISLLTGELCTGAQIGAMNQHLCCCIRRGNGNLYLTRPLLFTEEGVEI